MGFFSANCRACGHPLLSRAATTEGVNGWMRFGVVVFGNGEVHDGEYDGYGRLDGHDVHDGYLYEGSVYHEDCWKALGKPMDFVGKSDDADDQGWFFDDGDHDMASPLHDEAARLSLAPVGQKKVAEITSRRRAEHEAAHEFEKKVDAARSDKCPRCGWDNGFVVEKDGRLMVRCPNRECNELRELPAYKQALLRELFSANPDQHGPWDDDEINHEKKKERCA